MRAPAAVAIAAAALFAPAAQAAPPLVNVTKGTVAGVGAGRPLISFAFAWGPSDNVLTMPSGGPAVAVWAGTGKLARGVVTFADAGEQHASSVFYAGPLRTSRGDRTGTKLARLLAHWPTHDVPAPLKAMPSYFGVRVGKTLFVLDARKRLVGVAFGTQDALGFAGFHAGR